MLAASLKETVLVAMVFRVSMHLKLYEHFHIRPTGNIH
jgi:hypothetical protein